MIGWLRRLFPEPPLPSEYIGQFLDGKITHNDFVSNVGDGWVGSQLNNQGWLDELRGIERQFNPSFPSISLDAFKSDAAIDQLRRLRLNFLSRGL